jgi:CBS domain-containing protein
MHTVGEVMSRDVVTVRETTTLGEIARRLRKVDATVALVLDTYGDVVGIVTERELVEAVASSRHPDQGTAQSWMRRDFVVIPSSSKVTDADSMMRAGAFRQPPVMDAGRLVGIVGADELAASAAESASPA